MASSSLSSGAQTHTPTQNIDAPLLSTQHPPLSHCRDISIHNHNYEISVGITEHQDIAHETMGVAIPFCSEVLRRTGTRQWEWMAASGGGEEGGALRGCWGLYWVLGE